MANESELCTPWANDHYYLINGVKYAYETIDELDFIWLYDGMGKVWVKDVEAQGYQVIEPKLTRNNVKPQARSKMPSAGSASYYKNKVLEAA